MAEPIPPTPYRDIRIFVTTDAYRVKRRAFDAFVLTDDVGIAPGERRVYTDLSPLGRHFGTDSPTYEAVAQFFAAENPKPDLVWVCGVARTPGDPPTDWSEALTQLREDYGMFFYHVLATTRKPADRAEIKQWVSAEEAIFHTSNFPGERASLRILNQNEEQQITVSNATGGTFTLTFDDQTTAPIAYNATAAQVKAALEALWVIGDDDISVTGNAGGPWIVEFVGDMGNANQPTMTANGSGLQGNNPTVTVTVLQEGKAGLLIQARNWGRSGNKLKFQITSDNQPNQTLAVSQVYDSTDESWKLVVNPATDANGAITSTIADVANKINQTLEVAQRFRAVGEANEVVQELAVTPLIGGDHNAETLTQLYAARAAYNSPRVIFYYNPWPDVYWPEFLAAGQSAPHSPGSYWLKFRRVTSVPDVTDKRVFGLDALPKSKIPELRTNFINYTYTNEIDVINWGDYFSSDSQFADIQQKLDFITIDQRQDLQSLLTNPPARYVRGLPYDQEGIDLIVATVERNLIRNSQDDRRIVARDKGGTGKTLARVIAPTFREVAGTPDHKNRLYKLEWEATILLFIGYVVVRGYLTAAWVEPSLRAEQ